MSSGAGPEDSADSLLSVFGTPLLSALESDADRAAARALCLLADADPSVVPALTERLVGRLPEADDTQVLVRTLATLAADHTDAVRRVVADHRDRKRLSSAIADATVWEFDRAADGGSVVGAVRQAVDSQQAESVRPGVVERETDTSGRTADPERAADREHRGDPAAVTRRERLARAEQSEAFQAISLLGNFEEIAVVEPEQAVRYGSVLRTRATIDGEDHGVALRLFDPPDDEEIRRAFGAGVAEALAQWDGLAVHEGIATVHDWGDYPRPWVATPYLDGTLADRGRVGVERALRETAHLAGALAHCHNNGVVHGGLDPKTVVYPSSELSGLPAPRLDNVGILTMVREHVQPANYLDPRYAAPEYFDRSYGTVDAATDVYALGAVCYRLLTGRPPVTGQYDAVRKTILNEGVPAPSEREPQLPGGVDAIVRKATAGRKLSRYETAAEVRRDCWRLVRSLPSDE
ncbi:protein kinase domain-containing protein [Haloarcula sp. GH36]|uniref:protein kinase domain-containing protein n=1 Tax=Haloarcula montana TaxID=3111776 RepID=UPI002D777905|nr:serine/threonine protein kinase [Haloarcula sp. GH36]